MRRTILIVAALALGVAANVWEPGKTLPTYRVRQDSNGTIRVYDYGSPFEYRYRIEPDGSIYRNGDPFQKIGNIKNGIPTDKNKKGVK